MNDEILKRIDLLAAKLDTTAAHLWAVLIRQARVEAITDGIILVLACFGWYGIYRITRHLIDSGDDSPMWLVPIMGTIASLIATIVCLEGITTELLNPEYFALHQILAAIK